MSVPETVAQHHEFMALVQAILDGDTGAAHALLSASPKLASSQAPVGATRQAAREYYLDAISHYLYAGDTALHIAAAAYQEAIALELIARGANVRAKNRRGAEPLHYAADGMPSSRTWNPTAQAAIIRCLLEAGAEPNCADRRGATPLHRAVRTRCASAVRALLEGGADARLTNKSGSTPIKLAGQSTGRGGVGTAAAKEQQQEIFQLLQECGAN
ncbi:MAG: ankyrin repeat domain-containing protein [Rhodomicrobium sp.]